MMVATGPQASIVWLVWIRPLTSNLCYKDSMLPIFPWGGWEPRTISYLILSSMTMVAVQKFCCSHYCIFGRGCISGKSANEVRSARPMGVCWRHTRTNIFIFWTPSLCVRGNPKRPVGIYGYWYLSVSSVLFRQLRKRLTIIGLRG